MSYRQPNTKRVPQAYPKSWQEKRVSEQANKPKQPTEKEKQLQVEIDGLKKEVLMLRCDLNPAKIEEEIRRTNLVPTVDLNSLFEEQVRRLEYQLQQYEASNAWSSEADTKLQTNDKTTHEREIQERDQTIAALEEKLKILAADKGKEKEQNSAPAKSTKATQQLQEKCKTLENEIKIKDSEIRNHKVTIDEQKGLIDKMKKDLNEEKLKNEARKTNIRKAEPNQKNDTADKKDTDKEMRGQLDQLRSANEYLEKERKDLIRSYDHAIMCLKSRDETIKQLEETIQKKHYILEKEKNTLKSAKESFEKEMKSLKREKESLEEGKKTLQKSYDEAVMNLKSKDGKIQQLEENLKKKKLSQVVGAEIMDNNTNFTELSDENRPTKLSEKYSELYDNEWTDAYEEVEKECQSEQKVIQHLYQMLLDIAKFCQKTADEYYKNIKSCVLSLPSAGNEKPSTASIGVTNMRQLKQLQKLFSLYLAEDVFKLYVKSKKLDFSKKGKTEIFTRKCTEICWLISCQDPPVILDTTNVKGVFDSNMFRTYTKSGKYVDYVVWPPLLLHKDGPLLCKGVAQGK